MAVATRRSKSVTIQPTLVNTAGSFLEDLPAKPKEAFSLREAVDQLRDPLKASLAKGYSYQDLAGMLREQGISISASTLKNYVPSGKRQASKAKAAVKAPRAKKAATKISETMSKIASVVEEEAPSTNGASPAPKRGRRAATTTTTPTTRTTKTAAKAATATTTKTPRATKAAATKATTKAPSTRGRKKAV
jgi:hypothetical protein